MKKILFVASFLAIILTTNGQENIAPVCFDITIDGYAAGLFDGIYDVDVPVDDRQYFNEPTYVSSIVAHLGPHWNGSGSTVEEPSTIGYRVSGATSTTQFNYVEEGVYTIDVYDTLEYLTCFFGDITIYEVEVYGGRPTNSENTIFTGDVDFEGLTKMTDLKVSGDIDAEGGLNVNGNVTFKGDVNFEGLIQAPDLEDDENGFEGSVIADGYTFPDGTGLTQGSVGTRTTNLAPDCFDIGESDPWEPALFDGDFTPKNNYSLEPTLIFKEPTYVNNIELYISDECEGCGNDPLNLAIITEELGTINYNYRQEEADVLWIGVEATVEEIYIQALDNEVYEMEINGPSPIISGMYEGDLSFNGKVGIGTSNPTSKLEVKDGDITLKADANDPGDIIFKKSSGEQLGRIWANTDGTSGLGFSSGDNIRDVYIHESGNVGIGTSNPTSKLTVDGKIECEEIEVKDIAADYVFEEGYNLSSLEEVEDFINENGHLPDVAPASETVKGVELVKFNTLLLQKIEELTLYMIEQQKLVSELSSKLQQLENK